MKLRQASGQRTRRTMVCRRIVCLHRDRARWYVGKRRL